MRCELMVLATVFYCNDKTREREWQRLIVYKAFGDREWYGKAWKNVLFNSRTASVRYFGPQNCQTQVYSKSQINRDTEILCGCPLMTWPPMMININTGVLGMMRHCFKVKLPYPLVCLQNFFESDKIFKTLPFPPNFLIETKFQNQI